MGLEKRHHAWQEAMFDNLSEVEKNRFPPSWAYRWYDTTSMVVLEHLNRRLLYSSIVVHIRLWVDPVALKGATQHPSSHVFGRTELDHPCRQCFLLLFIWSMFTNVYNTRGYLALNSA